MQLNPDNIRKAHDDATTLCYLVAEHLLGWQPYFSNSELCGYTDPKAKNEGEGFIREFNVKLESNILIAQKLLDEQFQGVDIDLIRRGPHWSCPGSRGFHVVPNMAWALFIRMLWIQLDRKTQLEGARKKKQAARKRAL